MTDFKIQKGWDSKLAGTAAELYDQAFGDKFSVAIWNKEDRIVILAKSFISKFSYCVLKDQKIVGLAGFQTKEGSLTGGMELSTLTRRLGYIKGIWAGIVLSLFERKPKERELVMDGIVVDSQYRGNGLGSTLLDVIIQYAKDNAYDSVRLDVIDSNPKAKNLYESKGFNAKEHVSYPLLKWLIGFSGATTMVHYL